MAKKTITPEEPKLFEKFWNEYAMKFDRIAAVRAWNNLDKDLRHAAIDGIQHYREMCEALGVRRMWPQGYLNHRRWEDEQDAQTDLPLDHRSLATIGTQESGCTEYKDLKSATSRITNAQTPSDGITNPAEQRGADIPDMAIW